MADHESLHFLLWYLCQQQSFVVGISLRCDDKNASALTEVFNSKVNFWISSTQTSSCPAVTRTRSTMLAKSFHHSDDA